MPESNQRNVACMAEIEASYGAGATFAPADDGFHLYRDATPVGFEMETEDLAPIREAYTQTTRPPGILRRPFNPVIYAQASGTLGTAPRFNDLLRACALVETVNSGTSVVYTPKSDSFESAAALVRLGNGPGVKYDMKGLRGNFVISGEAGRACPIEFAMRGLWSVPLNTGGSDFTGFASGGNNAVAFKSANLALDNGTVTWDKNTALNPLVFQSFRFDRGVSPEDDPDANSANAIIRTGLAPGECRLSLVVEFKNTLTSIINFEQDAEAKTTHAVSFVIGQVAGKKITLSAPFAQILDAKVQNEGARRRSVAVEYLLTNDDTDNAEFSLTFH